MSSNLENQMDATQVQISHTFQKGSEANHSSRARVNCNDLPRRECAVIQADIVKLPSKGVGALKVAAKEDVPRPRVRGGSPVSYNPADPRNRLLSSFAID